MKFLWILLISMSLWANIGTIMATKGEVSVYRNTNSIAAKNGMKLLKLDKIVTAKKSRTQIMLLDNTVITIGANSAFSFKEFKFDGTKESKVEMRAIRGFFRSVTGRIGKVAPERFKVKTASATIGIRGTDFSGDISVDSEIFKCYQGKIYIDFKGKEYNLDAGMVMEALKGKTTIKKFDVSKKKKEKFQNTQKTKKRFKKNSVRDLKSLDTTRIPQEVISDITRIIKNTENLAPSDITPNVQDRKEIKY